MTTDADRLFDLDEALGRIGRLAYRAWNDGTVPFDEVIEEVVLTCDSVLDGDTDGTLRAEVEAVLPESWCPDLPFQERLRNLIEVRRTWLNLNAAQQARISQLEAMANSFGESPVAADPDAVARLRLLLQGDLRAITITRPIIEMLQVAFGITAGPTLIEPAIICPRCEGEGEINIGIGPVPCMRCDGEGKVPDVERMRLRIAELEYERSWLREIADNANAMMAYMRGPSDKPPMELWVALELSLADHRNAGYENSDHPDDFTAPTWSASDPEPDDD